MIPNARRATLLFLLALFVAFSLNSAGNSEIVAFNKNSLKYHCVKCEWALKCTQNCIKITREDAISRGGVACKICRGVCR